MNEKFVLIAGLPEAGKSSYIGALSYVLSHHQGKALVQTKENNDPYVASLAESWMNMIPVDRSHAKDHDKLEFEVKKEDGEPFKMILPDFMGESFQRIIEQKEKGELKEWYKKTTSVLLLMRNIRSEFVIEDQQGANVESNTKVPIKPLTVEQISYQARNIMLLKYLESQMHLNHVVIGISAWDEVRSKKKPIDYLKLKMPAFYNYVIQTWPDVQCFGISAQGDKYKSDDNFIDVMQEKAEKGERAFVVGMDGVKDYDITAPLAELIY